MATIYDVATQAGTSISTVSNYLNKTKYVGPDKSKRVQDAIDLLAYVPSRAAKSLKTKHSNEIHVVLPNMNDPYFAHTFTGINHAFIETDYVVILHLSDDIPSSEMAIINKVAKSNPAGVILCTCQPQQTEQLTALQQACPVLFLYRMPDLQEDTLNVIFDDESITFSITKRLLTLGYKNIGLICGPKNYSNETASLDGYQKALQLYSNNMTSVHSHHLPHQKEEAIRDLFLHYANKPLPECFIASSTIYAAAIKDLYAIRKETCHQLIVFGYESRYNNDLTETTIHTLRACEQLGSDVTKMMVQKMRIPNEIENRTYVYKDQFEANMLSVSTVVKNVPSSNTHPTTSLKLLLLEDSLSVTAMQSLLPHFEESHNIKVEIETRSYDKLFTTIRDLEDPFDLCSIDMPWIADLVHNEALMSLDEELDVGFMKDDTGNFVYPSRLGLSNQSLYGVPYLIGLQMLFYRKDLFTDQQLKEEFYALYERELQPPTDWYGYNQIAKFFTKSYNPSSPTTFGTCLADYFKGSILGEILPRIWAYDGQIIDQNSLPNLCTPQVKKAFENYLEATNYGTSDIPHYAEDVAKLFCKKNVAMITSYVGYAPILYDRINSEVNGLVDFAPMPMDSSMVSGWSLCIHEKSSNKKEATAFLQWFLSMDISYRYSLITGNPTRQELYGNASLQKLYPWLPLALETFEQGHTRKIIGDHQRLNNLRDTLESMIAGIISRHQSSKSSLHSLLKQADRDLIALIQEDLKT